MDIFILLGTRPEATKFCSVLLRLDKLYLGRLKVILSGQQKSLINNVLQDLLGDDFSGEIWNLDEDFTTHFNWKEIFETKVTELLHEHKPMLLMVIGDTDTAQLGAKVASNLNIPVGHVEAGIRHENIYSCPEPEEMNRRYISKVAYFHLTPNDKAANNLNLEGIYNNVDVIGCFSLCSVLSSLTMTKDDYNKYAQLKSNEVVCSFHRSTSVWYQDALLHNFLRMTRANPELSFRVIDRQDTRWSAFLEYISKENNISIIPSLSPPFMLREILKARLVITDSAGIQQEAVVLGKPVITCRRELEMYGGNSLCFNVKPFFDNLNQIVAEALQLDCTVFSMDKIYTDSNAVVKRAFLSTVRFIDALGG